jgi:cytochrome c-type protein NapB
MTPRWLARVVSYPVVQARASHIAGAGVLAAALLGFFAGTRRPAAVDPGEPAALPGNPRRAPTYAELREKNFGANAALYAQSLDAVHEVRDLFAPVVQTEAERQAALQDRATRRAYDGAPPTIPHAIDQRSYPDCLSCHERGAKIGGKVAPRISHERYDSCTQCHVVASSPLPDGETPVVESAFDGLRPESRGERAWPGAPPTIPHTTRMRSQCVSCHGPGGLNGMRSSHPYRQSCTQCHAPSAEMDQAPSADDQSGFSVGVTP